MSFRVRINVHSKGARVETRDVVKFVEIRPSVREVAVPAAFRLAITSPGAGMRVSFKVTDPFVERVRVHGMGEEVAFGREGYEVSIPLKDERSPHTIGYSVVYRDDVPEGTRAAPVEAIITLVY